MGKFAAGAIIGLAAGLLYCYWKTITAVYEKRDVISSGVNAFDALQKFWEDAQKV